MRGNSQNNNNGGNSRRGGLGGSMSRNRRPTAPRGKRRNILGSAEHVDYFDIKLLQRFINDQGKILPRRITGATAHQQRMVASAIKHARHLALLPFVAQDIN